MIDACALAEARLQRVADRVRRAPGQTLGLAFGLGALAALCLAARLPARATLR